MSDPTAARENIQVEIACPSIRPATSKQPPQKQDSRIGFEPRWIVKGWRRDDIVSPAKGGVKQLYMSVNEGRQIERRPNRFTITWAQIIVTFRVASIVKIFPICADLSVCLLSKGHLVLPDSGSVFSPIPVFGWVETKWCGRCVDFDGGWTSVVGVDQSWLKNEVICVNLRKINTYFMNL